MCIERRVYKFTNVVITVSIIKSPIFNSQKDKSDEVKMHIGKGITLEVIDNLGDVWLSNEGYVVDQHRVI